MKSLLYSALILSMLCFTGCSMCGGGACGGGLQAITGGAGCMLGGRRAMRKAARASFSDQDACTACGTDEFISAEPCGCGTSGGCTSAPAEIPCDACGTDEFVSAQSCGGGGCGGMQGGGGSMGRSMGGGVGFSFGDSSGMGLGLNEKGSACRGEGTSRIGGGQFRSMVGGRLGGGMGCGCGLGAGCGLLGGHGGCKLGLGGRGLGGRGLGGRGLGGGLMGGLGGGGSPYGGQIPHTAQQPGAGTGMAPSYAYPYYTTRGPRDFLQDNPPTIGY